MAEVWTWGTVESKVRGGLEAFIQLCNVRFKRLQITVARLVGFFPGWFNVRDYGASGGGVADDAAAITRAIAAASAAGGGVVYFPAGTYLLRSAISLASNVTATGIGPKTVLQSETDTTDGHSLVLMDGVSKARLCHVRLDGKASARTLLSAASGAFITDSQDCVIEYVSAVDMGRTAANFEGVALGITGDESDAADTSGNRISHCSVEDTGGRLSFGIRLYTDWTVNQADTAYARLVRHNTISHNTIYGVGFNGIEIAGPATRFNLIEGNQSIGHLGVSAIEADKGAQYNRFIGNSVRGMVATDAAGEAAAFRDQGFPSGAHPERFATGNVWIGNTANAISRDDSTEDSLYGHLFSRSKGCTVIGSRITDVSSVGFASTTSGSRAYGCNATVERLRLESCRAETVNVGLALSAASAITGLSMSGCRMRPALYGVLNASAVAFTQITYRDNDIEAASAGTTGIDLGAEGDALVEGNLLKDFTTGIHTGTVAALALGFNRFLNCSTEITGSAVLVARALPAPLALGDAATRTDVALDVELGGRTTGTTQYGVVVDTIPDNTSTTRQIAVYGRGRSAASAYTVGTVTGLYAANPSAGAGSTITTAVGVEVEDITAGGTNNYAIRTGAGRCRLGGDVEIDGDLDHDGSEVGFFGVTPVSRASALTQTYATADRTLGAYTADDESAAYTGVDNLQVGTVYATVADLNALRVAYENLRAFTEDVAQHHNAVVDDLQAYGLEQ